MAQDTQLRVWKTWERQVVPTVVFEITSESSKDDDIGRKRALYESLGTEELWLFDPLGEWLDPRLTGFVHHRGRLAATGGSHSRFLDLDLVPDAHRLALTRGDAPRPPIWTEVPDLADALRREAEAADAARRELEGAKARIAALEAELARLRRG